MLSRVATLSSKILGSIIKESTVYIQSIMDIKDLLNPGVTRNSIIRDDCGLIDMLRLTGV
jgi:hypothetical protein